MKCMLCVVVRDNSVCLQADDADFAQWQYNMARRRSEGQFFQSLYQAENPGKRQVISDAQRLHAFFCFKMVPSTVCTSSLQGLLEESLLDTWDRGLREGGGGVWHVTSAIIRDYQCLCTRAVYHRRTSTRESPRRICTDICEFNYPGIEKAFRSIPHYFSYCMYCCSWSKVKNTIFAPAFFTEVLCRTFSQLLLVTCNSSMLCLAGGWLAMLLLNAIP